MKGSSILPSPERCFKRMSKGEVGKFSLVEKHLLGETLPEGQKHSWSRSSGGRRATLRVSLVSSVLFLGEFSHSDDKRHHVRIVQRVLNTFGD